jgi:hypothetical protein
MKKIMEITVLGTLAFALLGFGVNQWQKLHLERMLPTIPWVLIIQSIFMIIGLAMVLTLYYYFATALLWVRHQIWKFMSGGE